MSDADDMEQAGDGTPDDNGAGGARPRGRRALAVFERAGELDLRSTWQVAAGAILMPLGIGVILLAWYGAAHKPHVQQQIPYMVSGSFIGLGLMIVGGLLFWAHWLYRVYDQANLQHEQLMQAISRLADNGATNGAAPARSRGATESTDAYVATATGDNFHLPTCPVVARRRSNLRAVSATEASGMRPCRICEPLDAAATPS